MGRPRKPDRRDRQLNIRFTEQELAAIVEHAGVHGVDAVEYGRRALLRGKKLAPATLSLPSRLDHLVEAQLRRLGNLLNQLVRHLHMTGELLPDATSLLDELRILLRRLP